MKKLISIIAPMYNEEKLVHAYCEETLKVVRNLNKQYDFEILLVNDGSNDKTYEFMLSEQNINPSEISVICLSRNFGLEGAVNAGLTKANGEAVIVMDADLQDPPALIPLMIQKWEKGADVVIGSRVKRSNDSFFKKISAGFYYKILDWLSGKLKLEKNAANFRLLSRKTLSVILSLPEKNRVFRVIVPFIGMKTDTIEYDRDKRYAGKTKYSLKSMIPYALNSITGMSIEPLRKILFFQIIPMLGIIASIFGMFSYKTYMVLWIIMFFISICMILIISVLSIMAEYIAQIMIEVKGRPISIIYDYKPCQNAKKRGVK